MKFKYFEDFERLTTLTEDEVECEICTEEVICFDSSFLGTEEIDHICPKCLFEKKLYDRNIFTNQGSSEELLSQIKETFHDLNEEEQINLAKSRDQELEQATPQLITWQDFNWPCLDGDYAKFIGYGSKPLFSTLAPNGDGRSLFKQSLHADLQEYYTEEQWLNMVPDEAIKNYSESNEFGTLFYIFKSLTSNKLVIWWDSN